MATVRAASTGRSRSLVGTRVKKKLDRTRDRRKKNFAAFAVLFGQNMHRDMKPDSQILLATLCKPG